ncbi:MAG: O-antigen ligase family protein [Cyanobacteria bacterium P01_A01_bin.37]
MAYSVSDASNPIARRSSLLEQPALAWIVTVGLFLITLLGCVAGAGTFMRLAFPASSLAIAVYLYFFHPLFYINFNWFVWCFTPILRRLADYYRGAYDESSLMLTAPYLVTLVCILTLLRQFPKSHKTGDMPFMMAAGAVFFAFLVGILNNPLTAVARTFLDWMPPILFGLHISSSWRMYPELRRTTQTVFVWIAILAGSYGVYQYMVAPEWDKYWLEAVENVSFGLPEPQQIRVWSTMNSPPPFGCVMMATTLLLLICKGFWRIPAAGVGYLSLMLSLVRAAWAGWIVGLITLVISLKSNLQIKILITIMIMALCVVPLTLIEPFNEVIVDRLESFTNIQNDSSYEARAETYSDNLDLALSGFLGQGLGSTWIIKPNGQPQRIALDSGILDTFFTLGWFGGVPYIGGMMMLLFNQFRGPEGRNDPFASGARSITLSFFAILSLGPFMVGLAGMVMWGFLGLGMAARKHYVYQEKEMMMAAAAQIAERSSRGF